MNPVKIYNQAAGRVDTPTAEEVEKANAEKAVTLHNKLSAVRAWSQHPITQQLFASLISEANELDSQARELALANQASELINNKLIQSATLRKVITNATQLTS